MGVNPYLFGLAPGALYNEFIGGPAQQTKAARRSSDIANQTQEAENLFALILSQLIPGSEEYNLFLSEGMNLVRQTGGAGDQAEQIRQMGQQLVAQQQQRIAGGGPANAFEARTDKAFQGYRDVNAPTSEEQAVLNALRGLPQTGEGADTYSIFNELVGRAKDPNQYFEDTLAPELSLAQDAVTRRAATRGIVGSGIELENLGRAGVELAINKAREREGFRQSQLQNFQNLYNVGQGLRQRQIGVEESQTNLQRGREQELLSLISGEGSRRLDQTGGIAAQNVAYGREDVGTATALQEARRKELFDLAKTAATIPFAGAGGTAGAGTFTAASGASTAINANELLALQRAGYGGQTSPTSNQSLVDLLTRRRSS